MLSKNKINMEELREDACAEFSSHESGFSASYPLSTSYMYQTSVPFTDTFSSVPQSTDISTYSSDSATYVASALNSEASYLHEPVTSSGILEAAAFLSGILQLTDQGGLSLTTEPELEVPNCGEKSQNEISLLGQYQHLSDSDSDAETSVDNLEITVDNDHDQNMSETAYDSDTESDVSLSDSDEDSISSDSASSDDECVITWSDDSESDDSSTDDSDALTDSDDEDDEIFIPRKPRTNLHKATATLVSGSCTSNSTGVALGSSYSGQVRGRKRKQHDLMPEFNTKKQKLHLYDRDWLRFSMVNEQSNSCTSYDNQSSFYYCPGTCPCKKQSRVSKIPRIKRKFKVTKPLYEKFLQSRLVDDDNLSEYQCCERDCSYRWYSKGMSIYSVLDDYWHSDLDVYHFSWGVWKDEEGHVY